MNKLVFILTSILLTACTSHPEVGQPQAPLDMKSVDTYNAKIYSGNTVPDNQKVKQNTPVNMPMNASDNQPKVSSRTTTPVILMPSIGYHYGHHHW